MIKVYRLPALLTALCLFSAVALAALFLRIQPTGQMLSAVCADGDLPVLVLDPGHGGEDGGAVSVTGTRESVINLDIGLRAADLAGLIGLPCRLTRESESIAYPPELKTTAQRKTYDQHARVDLINGTPNAVLLSIHQNFFPKSSARGPQVFYAGTPDSDVFADCLREELNAALLPENTRAAKPIAEKIYLMKNVHCTAVLVECGFLSNAGEARLLDTNEYRLKAASALISGYLSYLQQR
ncbi:MAG: N-acetylmuramoyl-L-alanine amidase [Oscillospiraceae bacterium]|jgi:N-acetylmuramoyl-L-alanine amidase